MHKAHKTQFGWLVVLDFMDGTLPWDTGMRGFNTEDEARLQARLLNVSDHIYG